MSGYKRYGDVLNTVETDAAILAAVNTQLEPC